LVIEVQLLVLRLHRERRRRHLDIRDRRGQLLQREGLAYLKLHRADAAAG
jgi:hypothetical protein